MIDRCASMSSNPILLIHDVGAGGLSNALPELVHDAGMGATFQLRAIDSADAGMNPLQIWCCEAQERYVAIIAPDSLAAFRRIAERERCGYSLVGTTTGQSKQHTKHIVLVDSESVAYPEPVNLPMDVLFGKPPKMVRSVQSRRWKYPAFDPSLTSYVIDMKTDELLTEAVNRVLAIPSVGSKSFLITIGDRSVGGLTTRDQMVGPWQIPVADVSVTATGLFKDVTTGEAMAIGERPPIALVSPAAAARIAVAEALQNLAAADLLDDLARVRLSANWMAASSHTGEGAALYEAVEAIGKELCPDLRISIPVGKDSMSMKMTWQDPSTQERREVTAPLSVVITAFAPVKHISRTWTPQLQRLEDVGETLLMFVDLADGKKSLGGSTLAQSFSQVGDDVPDVRDVELFKDYFDAIGQLHQEGIVLAYHDRSDGGLFTTLVEMMFAGRCGLEVMLDQLMPSNSTSHILEALFNEELGAVFQIRKSDEIAFKRCFASAGPPPGLIKRIGRVTSKSDQKLTCFYGLDRIFEQKRCVLQQRWSATSFHMQKLRDEQDCALAEHENILDDLDPGLSFNLSFKPSDNIMPFSSNLSAVIISKPRVAILREQGVNGQAEMAFAFHSAGFSTVDVHMTDLISGQVSLASFIGLAACGGFSYGDVLGAGRGWAASVLEHRDVRHEFETFFARKDTFTLGVCNGCQFLSRIKDIIPEAFNWPTFEQNQSEQFEARVSMVEISAPPKAMKESSVFFHGMHGSKFPIVVSHGEGKATFPANGPTAASAVESGAVPIRYIDNFLTSTERYPFNPNGSPLGIAAVQTLDGRCLAMMPHPERIILKETASWLPEERAKVWGSFGPWIRMFKSARRWCG